MVKKLTAKIFNKSILNIIVEVPTPMSKHIGSESTLYGVITHSFNALLPLYISKYFTSEHQLVYMSVITIIATYILTQLNDFLQRPGIIKNIITCGYNRGKDAFVFTFDEIPSNPVIRFHSVVDNQDYATEILWWILKNTKSNFGTTTLQIKSNIINLFENGTINRTEFRDRAILLVGGERNWIPLCKDSIGTFAYYKMWGNGDDFHIGIGSETYKCYEYVWSRIAQEGITKRDASKSNLSNAMQIYKIGPNSHEMIGTASKKRTFDSLFFEEKDRLIRILTAFKEKTMYPPHIGSDNKLGILLHGPPGTGKTHAVVATANFLGRSIASVSMRDVKTCNDFDKVLDYPRNTTVFVLEEIDCVLGVLRKRSAIPVAPDTEEDDDEYNKLFQVYINTEDKDQKAQILDELQSIKKKKSNRLTLSYILEKLDGITDESDRIIIATTNYPELLDEALLRPGRLGFHLNLGLCTQKMIIDILVHYFGLNSEKSKELEQITFEINKYSPAQLIQHIQMDTNIESVIEFIKKKPITDEIKTQEKPIEVVDTRQQKKSQPIPTKDQIELLLKKRKMSEVKRTSPKEKQEKHKSYASHFTKHSQYHYHNHIQHESDSAESEEDDSYLTEDEDYDEDEEDTQIAHHYLTESLIRHKLENRIIRNEELNDIVKNEEERLLRTALPTPIQ